MLIIFFFLILSLGCINGNTDNQKSSPSSDINSTLTDSSINSKENTQSNFTGNPRDIIYQSAISKINFSAGSYRVSNCWNFVPPRPEPDRIVLFYELGRPENFDVLNQKEKFPRLDQKYVIIVIGNTTYRSLEEKYRSVISPYSKISNPNLKSEIFPAYAQDQLISVFYWPEKVFVGNYILEGTNPGDREIVTTIEQDGVFSEVVLGMRGFDQVRWDVSSPEAVTNGLFYKISGGKPMDYTMYSQSAAKLRPDVVLQNKGFFIESWEISNASEIKNNSVKVELTIRFLPSSTTENKDYDGIVTLVWENSRWKLDDLYVT